MEENKDNKKTILLVLILFAIIILIFIALEYLGKIDNKPAIPTGIVDIFDVIFEVGDKVITDIDNEKDSSTDNKEMIIGKIKKNNTTNQSEKNEIGTKPDDNNFKPDNNDSNLDDNDSKPNENDSNPDNNDSKPDNNESKPDDSDQKPDENDPKPDDSDQKPDENDPKPDDSDPKPNDGVTVHSDETTWSNWTNLNIFKNASYFVEDNKIAPTSENSYQFIIRNNNNFSIKYNLELSENNEFNINMKYRLKQNGKYVVGDTNEYVTYDKLNQYNVNLINNAYDVYTLDWKWIESENDTQIGEQDIDVNYKLNLQISAMQV